MTNGVLKTNSGFSSMLTAEYLGTTNVPIQMPIGTGTNTPSPSDTALQTEVYTSNLVSGYPAVDTSALKATIRSKIGTTEANGNAITEFGPEGATGNIKDRAVVDAVSKTSSDIIDFVIITKIRNKE